jgi:hypothetical protein
MLNMLGFGSWKITIDNKYRQVDDEGGPMY